jgi:hypothetical protein
VKTWSGFLIYLVRSYWTKTKGAPVAGSAFSISLKETNFLKNTLTQTPRKCRLCDAPPQPGRQCCERCDRTFREWLAGNRQAIAASSSESESTCFHGQAYVGIPAEAFMSRRKLTIRDVRQHPAGPSSCLRSGGVAATCDACGARPPIVHKPIYARGTSCASHCPNCCTPAEVRS